LCDKMEEKIKSTRSIQQTYDAIAAEFDATRYKPWPQTMAFVNGLPEHGTILDLGCGNGRNVQYLASVHRGFRIIGLDFSSRMLNLAKGKLDRMLTDSSIEFVLGDIIKLPFASSSLNGAIFVAALHHLPTHAQRLAALLELERCLRPRAQAFISVWDFEQERFANELKTQLAASPHDHEFGDVLVPWTGKRGKIHQRFYHLFYKDELEQLLGETNLEINELYRAADNYHAVVLKK
jgi:tRNA (uracil-5-)-methyltransferase TRM9